MLQSVHVLLKRKSTVKITKYLGDSKMSDTNNKYINVEETSYHILYIYSYYFLFQFLPLEYILIYNENT